jgi:hypothetical protein
MKENYVISLTVDEINLDVEVDLMKAVKNQVYYGGYDIVKTVINEINFFMPYKIKCKNLFHRLFFKKPNYSVTALLPEAAFSVEADSKEEAIQIAKEKLSEALTKHTSSFSTPRVIKVNGNACEFEPLLP